MRSKTKHTGLSRLTLALAAAIVACLIAPAAALAAPALQLSMSATPSSIPARTPTTYDVDVTNTGNQETSGMVTVEFNVPAGLKILSTTDEVEREYGQYGVPPFWSCSIAGDKRSVSCQGPEEGGTAVTAPPGAEICEAWVGIPCGILIKVSAEASALGEYHPTATACGGGASACPSVAATAPDSPLTVTPFEFGLKEVDGAALEEDGEPATQAGSHPFEDYAGFLLKTYVAGDGHEYPFDEFKDAASELPPGLLGNPQSFPQCTQLQLTLKECPMDSQVGTVSIWFIGQYGHLPPGGLTHGSETVVPLYNIEASYGVPALFGFNFVNNITMVYAHVRNGQDYGITLTAKSAPQNLPIGGVKVDLWGSPAAATHDVERGYEVGGLGAECSTIGDPACHNPFEGTPHPFVTLPTSCTGPVLNTFHVTGWYGGEAEGSFLSHDNTEPDPNPIGYDGCNALDYTSPSNKPSLQARPTTNVADSASGLDVDLHTPQHEECSPLPAAVCENAEANLKDATVTLPEGLVINPASANGLGGCSEAQFGYTETDAEGTIHTTGEPASCPDSSKQGTVTIESPLLNHPMKGAVYLANPYANPFDSLLALYVSVNDPKTDITVNLAGKVTADPNTGRLSASFAQNPQLPFEHFLLHFFGGAGGPLRTPATCGTYQTNSSLTPWSAPDSGPPASVTDSWAIQQAPGGGACPSTPGARPNSPDLDAGSVSPIAAASTPTIVNIRREDDSQEFSRLSLTLPPGLTGRLVGIAQCSDAALAAAAKRSGTEEKAAPSCPASSRVGDVEVGAGAGPAPYYVHGNAYLAGPYKGAPLSMAIVTPAVAGPFDLGTVVVRVALQVDPTTAQITAQSDELPHILAGIPLDIRSAKVTLDRQGFTRNGTSCNPSAFNGSLSSTLGQSAPLTERFQLGECTALPFKPTLGIRLTGSTTRGGHPALEGTLTMPEGGANIATASVALPHSEFIDQSHFGTVCTRVQFAEGNGNGSNCPAGSIYGTAVARSPLVDYPLEGVALLRSSNNKLPDLVVALHGPPSQPIQVSVAARVDSVKGGIRTSFEGLPDLPVSSFVLNMQGGKKGLFQNSTNICKGTPRATGVFVGQNGKGLQLTPALKNAKCTKAKRRHKRHHNRHAAH